MIKVIAKAKIGNVCIQDPRPEEVTGISKISWTIPAKKQDGTEADPVEMVMTWSQYERVVPQLDAQVAAGNITLSLAPAGLSGLSEQPEADNSPVVDAVNVAALAVAGGAVQITVSNLFGVNQALASLTIPAATPTTTIVIRSLLCSGGNRIAVKIVAGSALAVTFVNNLLTITLATGGSRVDAIVAAIQAVPAAQGVLMAELGGLAVATILITAAMAETYLTGGKGDGILATIGGVACVITDINTVGAISTIVTASPALTASTTAAVQVRSNNKSSQIGVAVAAA